MIFIYVILGLMGGAHLGFGKGLGGLLGKNMIEISFLFDLMWHRTLIIQIKDTNLCVCGKNFYS